MRPTHLLHRLHEFVSELRRRRVFRVAAIYLAGAAGILGVAGDVADALDLAVWVPRAVLYVLAVGFPVTLVLSWVYDLTARGVVRTDPEPTQEERRARGTRSGDRPTLGALESIAVLPFADMSPGRDQEYFSDGITEELLNVLAQVEGLRVPARTSSFAFKGKNADIRQIGEQLDVDTVLEGSVRTHQKRVRISAQLIEVETGYHLWSDTYDRELSDIFAVQEEISREIVSRLVGPRAKKDLHVKLATGDTEAYDYFLKGRYAWNKRTEEGLKEAIGLFERAVSEDLFYAEAYAGLADSYVLLGYFGYLPPNDVYPRAKAAALNALRIDDSLASAHTALAAVLLWYEWDWDGARREFRRAIGERPTYATAHHWYGGGYLTTMGRLDEAVAELRQAHRLDPLSPIIPTGLGRVHYWARQYDRAVEQFRMTLDLNPGFVLARTWLGATFLQQGKPGEAMEELRTAAAAAPRNPVVRMELARACARAGLEPEAREILSTLGREAERTYVSPDFAALIHTELGDSDEAFAWLERACRERATSLVTLRIEPAFDPLRSDPRFDALLTRVGLP
jgi:TolB-like protein/Tfp pilus assembly protein PilF